MQNNIIKSSMINGLIMGAIFTVNFFITVPKNSLLAFISIVLSCIIVVLMYRMAIRFRDNECGGNITYGKSLLYTILTFFFGALIVAIVKFFYVQFINKELLDYLLQVQLKLFESWNVTIDEEMYTQLEKMNTPIGFVVQTIWSNLIYGTIIGLILSFFVKKAKSIFE